MALDAEEHYLNRKVAHLTGSDQSRELEELRLSRYRELGLWKA